MVLDTALRRGFEGSIETLFQSLPSRGFMSCFFSQLRFDFVHPTKGVSFFCLRQKTCRCLKLGEVKLVLKSAYTPVI